MRVLGGPPSNQHGDFTLSMGSSTLERQVASFESALDTDGGGLTLAFEGRLDAATTADLWQGAVDTVRHSDAKRLVVDASRIDYCDGAGVGLLVELIRVQKAGGGEAEVSGLSDQFRSLLDQFNPADFSFERERPHPTSTPEEVGRATFVMVRDLADMATYVGELTVALVHAARHPRSVRWKDAWLVAEAAGVNALPIVSLIGFLVGLIMAFQSAIPMKQFGAEIFVANLVALSMLRELGPLMTAIVLAGRSGSAFAAEIGTMKVNEEINALTTMGLDPVRFLVVTRVLAAVVMTPILVIFANLAGLIGGAVVILSFDYPLITYVNQVIGAVGVGDLMGGLVKAFVFGILVAGVGCMRGLRTGTGARAVGDSTTRAVVSGIVLIALTDGVFSVVYYYLGI